MENQSKMSKMLNSGPFYFQKWLNITFRIIHYDGNKQNDQIKKYMFSPPVPALTGNFYYNNSVICLKNLKNALKSSILVQIDSN